MLWFSFWGLALGACAATPTPLPVSPTPEPSPIPTDATDLETPMSEPEVDAPQAALPDEVARELLYDLIDNDRDTDQAALDRILEAGDQRFIAVFIELVRAFQLTLVRTSDHREYGEALEALSGQSLGLDWPGWVEWYGNTDLQPPPGFTGWKGQLLGRIDPAFARFLADDQPSRIRVEEIQWGGVRLDGIPALDNPRMLPAAEADYLDPGDPVFGIALNGDARAYPLRILDWHEMANDVVGGVPVSLAYCTLCGAAIAYDGRASDGGTYTFGSSGFLFRSNKLMYDRQTRTLWNQFTGEPVLGELAGEAPPALSLLPVVLTTWEAWQAQHPETRVLDVDTGFQRPYTPGAAYGGYFASPSTMFPVAQRDERLAAKDQVYGLRLDGVPKAYPLDLLAEAGVVNDTLAGTPVVLVMGGEPITVQGESLREGPATYSAGAEVRAYDRGAETFTPSNEAGFVFDSAGQPWQITEQALLGPQGRTAPRVSGHLAYWFGWYAFFPQSLLYETPG